MLREIPPVAAAMALVLGAAPAAFAQSAPVPAEAQGSTAARTLEQNRRVLLGQPPQLEVPRGTIAGPPAPAARVDEARAAPPAGRAGRRS